MLQGNSQQLNDTSQPKWDELPEDVVLRVLSLLAMQHAPEAQAASMSAAGKSFVWFRRSVPLVCRRWAKLLGGGGPWHWQDVIVSSEQEVNAQRRRRPDTPVASLLAAAFGALSPTSAPTTTTTANSTSSLVNSTPAATSSPGLYGSGNTILYGGTSPPTAGTTTTAVAHPFSRPASLGPFVTLRASCVLRWLEARAGCVRHLALDLGGSVQHDITSGRVLDALLKAANRGPRGLASLRMHGVAGVDGQDSYEVLSRLQGLQELAVSGLPQGFLSATLPYISRLTNLTRLLFTPEAFQFPVSVPALPVNLRSLALSSLWMSRLPPVASSTSSLQDLALHRCCLVSGCLTSLAAAPHLRTLSLDGSSLTTEAGGRLGWDAAAADTWPHVPSLQRLSMAGCSLRSLPPAVIDAFPNLTSLDCSGNPELGGGPGGAAGGGGGGAAAAGLPAELHCLTALAEVALAGCGLTAVPPPLLRVSGLTALDLSSNSLSVLPLPLPPSPSPPAGSCAVAAGGPTGGCAGASPQPARWLAGAAVGDGPAGDAGGAVAAPPAAVVAAFAGSLVRLNIALNRFTAFPQGLLACTRLTELVVGALLLARAGEGELERLVAALPALARLEVRGASFEPRAVRHLLGVQRLAGRLGRPVVEVTGG